MTRAISRRRFEFLQGELAFWRNRALISGEQEAALLELYGVKSYSLARVLLGGGAALLGMGVSCVVAANWWEIARAWRVVFLVAAYLACIGAAAACPPHMRRTGAALHLLASLVFGAGIFLIAQMYHHEGHWSQACGLWALGVLPGALLLRDRAQTLLFQGLVGAYSCAELLGAPLSGTLRADVLPALAVTLAWLPARSVRGTTGTAWALTLTFVFLRLCLRLHDSASAMLLYAVGGGVCCLVFSRAGWRRAAAARTGLLIAGVFGLLLTIPDFWFDFSFLAQVGRLMGQPGTASVVRHTLAAGAAGYTALLMFWMLWRGSRPAGVFLVLLALRYFVDHFFGFMSKGAVFSCLGALLLALGFWCERRAGARKEKNDE